MGYIWHGTLQTYISDIKRSINETEENENSEEIITAKSNIVILRKSSRGSCTLSNTAFSSTTWFYYNYILIYIEYLQYNNKKIVQI